MKIAVRLDDITPDMDWERFGRMEKMLEENGIAPLLGIVPDNHDPNLMRQPAVQDFEEKVKKWNAKGYSFALHGWRHIYTTQKGGIFPLNHFSEFAGVTKEKQQQMISDGQKKLQDMGIKTDIFMAPAHSFDKNTLTVLQEAGFHYLTDGFGKYPYQRQGLTFLPIAFQKRKDIKKAGGYTTLVFHTNVMKEEDFVWFEKILNEHRGDFISYREYLQIPAQKEKLWGRGKVFAMANFKHFLMRLYPYAGRKA